MVISNAGGGRRSSSKSSKGKVMILTPNLKGLSDPNSVHRIQPPLGPMIMANIIRERGYEVRIHDCALADFSRHESLDTKTILIGQADDDIHSVIACYQPEVVGISALFSNLIGSAHNIARLVKKASPRAFVVLGGNHISNAVKDYLYAKLTPNSGLPARLPDLEDQNIDFAMHGEVDLEFPNLVESLIEERELGEIPGLVRRHPSKQLEYIINAQPTAIADLSSLPLPARDLVDMEGYFAIGAFHSAKSRSKRVVSVMASRGCPEVCTFCTTPGMWGPKVRWRKMESILEEITQAKQDYQVGEIQFKDDTLTAHRKNLLELCKGLEKIGLPWCTPNGTKVNYHLAGQLDMYKAMHDSGCYQITLACESGVQRVLDNVVKKNLQLEQIKPSIENAKKAGMLVHTFWILGYPGETYEEILQTVEFAKESGADSFSFSILNPLPGTPIYRKVVQAAL